LVNIRRILTTGAIAVVATIGFAIFAYRAAEWSRGMQSGVVVLGQGTNTGGGSTCQTSGTGTSAVQTTKVIPQVALGSFDSGLTKYSTIMEIVNTGGAAQSISGNFYKEDGSALDNVALSAGSSTINNGVLPATQIAKDGILIVSGSGNSTGGVIGWGKINACGGVSISTFFELRDGSSGVVLSRVGVAASPANMSSFVIPRVREVSTGLDVGFALVNTGSASATLTAELKDATGATLASKNIVMGAGAHQAGFTKDVFAPLSDGNSRLYQYVKFNSPSPSFAAIALAFEGPTQTSFPVDVLQ
jgi:hypothetical protein